MSLMEDLQNKLVATEERVVAVLGELKEFSDLKQSLNAADMSLYTSSERLGHLATSLTKNADSMQETIGALREAIDIIKLSDPAKVIDAQNRIESLLRELDKNLAKALNEAKVSVLEKIGDTENMLKNISAAGGELAVALEALGERFEETKKSTEGSLRGGRYRQFCIIGLLICNLAALLYLGIKDNAIKLNVPLAGTIGQKR